MQARSHNLLTDGVRSDAYIAGVEYETWKRECGRRLRAARKKKDWTLEVLAAESQHLTKSGISNYEQGLRPIPPFAAFVLGRLLDVSPAYLLGIDDAITEEERKLLEKYRQTDDRGRKSIQSSAESQPAVKTPEVTPDNQHHMS